LDPKNERAESIAMTAGMPAVRETTIVESAAATRQRTIKP
jgi:hypothetical protein